MRILVGLIFLVGLNAFAGVSSNEKWMSADPMTVTCDMTDRATFSIAVHMHNVFHVIGVPFISTPQVETYLRCNAAVEQAALDKTLVYINLTTGEVKPDDGFFVRSR